jgi:DtxR family Mn-dependent transcriptional regulator
VSETSFPRLSESVQNYLVNIVRLRESEQEPVPLSQLAEALSISPISVNDMCRKLQDQGLVVYRPYKGVYLTEQGQRRAYYILRRHRLWEVFLVQKLGFDYEEAHEAACRLEHATSDSVADHLDVFLDHPTVNPQGLPIPRPEGILPNCTPRLLSELSAGERAHILQCSASVPVRTALAEQGLRPGATIEILVVSEQSQLLLVDDTHVSVAQSLAQSILVEPLDSPDDVDAECTLHPLPAD